MFNISDGFPRLDKSMQFFHSVFFFGLILYTFWTHQLSLQIPAYLLHGHRNNYKWWIDFAVCLHSF